MTPAEYKLRLQAWRNAAEGFFAWLADVRPMVPSHRGGYVAFELTPEERDEVRKALSGNYKTIVFCWPRRHGKTLIVALIILWRFTTRQTQNVVMIANSEKQTTSTAFRLVSRIVTHTPFLKNLIGEKNIQAGSISYPDLDNTVAVATSNDRSLYGGKVSIAQVSELHAAFNDDAYQVLASSIGDSDDGVVLIDSTVGSRMSPLYKLFSLWESGEDPSIFFSHLSYQNLDDALERAPAWLSRDWLRSRSKQMLPALFAPQHLNQWTSGSNALFPDETIAKCTTRYGFPVTKAAIPSLIGGSKFAVGGGLDRAYGFSLHGDNTVFTAALKTTVNDEAHYWVLYQKKIPFSSGSGIKKAIEHGQREYAFHNVVLESYNAQDIWSWCQEQNIPNELIHPTAKAQIPAFTELHLIASEGRLHVSEQCSDLLAEMRSFEYEIREGGNPSFGHAQGHKDDHVYSLAWAVYSLRDVELPCYEIQGITCQSRYAVPEVCYLLGGQQVPFCSAECKSALEVEHLYQQHRERHPESELTVIDFFTQKTKNAGAVVYRW